MGRHSVTKQPDAGRALVRVMAWRPGTPTFRSARGPEGRSGAPPTGHDGRRPPPRDPARPAKRVCPPPAGSAGVNTGVPFPARCAAGWCFQDGVSAAASDAGLPFCDRPVPAYVGNGFVQILGGSGCIPEVVVPVFVEWAEHQVRSFAPNRDLVRFEPEFRREPDSLRPSGANDSCHCGSSGPRSGGDIPGALTNRHSGSSGASSGPSRPLKARRSGRVMCRITGLGIRAVVPW